MLLLFTLLLFVALDAYEISALNEFSADVDIYDMGTMGRGKNACSWHRSLAANQEVFYYLAMQPWRHLVWTDCTGTQCYKYYINEDASAIPQLVDNKYPKLSNKDVANDYCRKEYANPLPTFDIDWTQIDENGRLETIDINGNTCYKYPALQPLANIYLDKQFMKAKDVDVMIPCRFDFIGGKSITFRSFNKFSEVFISNDKTNGYLINKTRCNIDPSPNNVDTDLAIILGISDASIVQLINPALTKLGELTTVKQVKVYYISGNSLKRETIALDNLASLIYKSISSGPIDALINTAKNDLVARINSKAIYRGTIVALMDRALSSTFDAETAFDRNNITVHTILYNPRKDNQMRVRARTLLSVGDHYHEFTSSTTASITQVVDELFSGIRVNLTERCNRTSCNGFCDGRDRCTCPMCCENTCFFTYCNTTTATCTPWPEANPKKKLTCKNDCVGTQECIDLQGCVYTEYNEGCAPRAKCMKPYCDGNNVCQQKSSCEQDKTPSYQNRCWNYTCNEENGNCERQSSGDACPKLADLCEEYYCLANLTCATRKKTCVKTAPYIEMECYKAKCNKRTGVCENVLSCEEAFAQYTGCGDSEGLTLAECTCNPSDNFKCTCVRNNVDQSSFCTAEQICDSSNEGSKPECKKSACKQDLYIQGCEIKTCNEATGEIEWKEYDCTKNVTIKAVANKDGKYKDEAELYCKDKYEILCEKDEENGGKASCKAVQREGVSDEAGCGACYFSGPVVSEDGYMKTYSYYYDENCNYLKVTCPNGEEIVNSSQWFNNATIGVCGDVNVTVFNETTKKDEIVQQKQCIYNQLNYTKMSEIFEASEVKPHHMCESCFTAVECFKALEFREYTYDETTGQCDMFIVNEENIPGCSACNANKDGYTVTCSGKVPKTYEHKLGDDVVTFNYAIPYICGPADQCIPDPEFDCGDITLNPEIGDLFELFKTCANEDGVKYEYHYSTKFDFDRYYKQRSQSAEFMKEAVEKAFCTYDFHMDPCKYCSVSVKEGATNIDHKYTFTKGDKCVDLKNKTETEYKEGDISPDSYVYTCNEFSNECERDLQTGNCTAKQCYYYWWDNRITEGDKCARSEKYTCAEKIQKQQEKFAAHDAVKQQMKKDIPVLGLLSTEREGDIFMKCYSEVKCQDDLDAEGNQLNCTYDENGDICKQAYNEYIENNRDFGCRIPNIECNMDALICTFTKLEHPLNDTRFFQDRDGVVFGDKCYEYDCQEYINATTGKIEHHWVLKEKSVIELSKEPETICDTVHCDPETGKSVSERRLCDPISDYGLTERMAQCFQCACSMQTGENVLTMRPNTETETYELDACGNCVVRDRATGNQVNEVVECVLAQPVNLTGAIAGATVAASVVFGLIGSMVVVSIGALQTYQLVSSAMKNVISTTLENPEFVAADNEATNVLNNGD